LKSLSHYGVYIPTHSVIGLKIKCKGKEFELSLAGEQMAIAFVRKFDTPYTQDETFVQNFIADFATELISSSVGFKDQVKGNIGFKDFDFSAVKEYLEKVKTLTQSMTKQEKKKATELKKTIRDMLKEKYGFAIVDGDRIPLMNWISEPSGIFMSRGLNPLRGRWKRSVTKDSITLNISKAPDDLDTGWANIVWKPDEMWIASWKSPLDGKMKYVWFSPATGIRQDKERKKFSLASQLGNELCKLEKYIEKELGSSDIERRKLSTAVYLIKSLAIRVGDEKLAGEHGTVGCTTLKKDNVTIEGNKVHLSFIGKDYVKLERDLIVPEKVKKNLVEFIKEARESYLFKDINSEKIAKFLREKIPGLSAKVFRTYIAGTVWDEHAKENLKMISDETSVPVKKYLFKLTNLEVAKKLNHRKALPKNYEERLAKKKLQLETEKIKLDLIKKGEYKKIQAQIRKAEKIACEFELLRDTTEWNLGTSLTSYISPIKVQDFCQKAHLELQEVYSKGLLDKFSWISDQGKKRCGKYLCKR